MLQPRIYRPVLGIEPTLSSLAASLTALSLCSRHQPLSTSHPSTRSLICVRHASHASQGRANGPKDSAGRRLGAKKSESQYVIPGNIIFKQRGTHWHPGENVDMGKDHTIYATVAGYVRYYRNPDIHPKRKYIGVSLERSGKASVLPTPRNAVTRRRLCMHASPMGDEGGDGKSWLEGHLSASSTSSAEAAATAKSLPPPPPTPAPARKSNGPAPYVSGLPPPTMRADAPYMTNYDIGRAAERKGVQVREFDRGDRWLAWRKRAAKAKAGALARAAKATRKTKGKKPNARRAAASKAAK